jgi:hypothetical protein
VSIFDLNDVTQERVGGHRLNEVCTSLLELDGFDWTVLEREEAEEVVDLRSTHFISRSCVRNDIDYSAL